MERITTTLHTASHFGQIFKIDALIDEGIPVNAKDSKGCTPLHLAITGYSVEATVIRLLGIKGCLVNAQDDSGQTPLHWAAGRGHVPVIMLLLKNGADINIEDKEGRTALNNAIRECETEAVEMLLKEGGFYPESMFTAINAEDCDAEIMKLLLPFYYDIDSVRNKGGETFLHVAVSSLYADIPEVLLEAEASVNAKCTFLKETPLHKALKFLHFREDGTTLLASLLKRLPDITVKNYIGQTPVELSLDLPDYQQLFIEHTCKLIAADMFKLWHLNIPIEIIYYHEQTKYYATCLEELKYLKNTEVEDVSLYTLLTKSRISLLRLLRNKNLRDNLTDEYLEQCYSQIPVYKDILREKLKHALRRAGLIESCRIFFSCLNLPLVPPHCVDAILSYLTWQELVSLSKVCEGLA